MNWGNSLVINCHILPQPPGPPQLCTGTNIQGISSLLRVAGLIHSHQALWSQKLIVPLNPCPPTLTCAHILISSPRNEHAAQQNTLLMKRHDFSQIINCNTFFKKQVQRQRWWEEWSSLMKCNSNRFHNFNVTFLVICFLKEIYVFKKRLNRDWHQLNVV